eukprot:5757232-Pyramimonas_sp.AAC.1
MVPSANNVDSVPGIDVNAIFHNLASLWAPEIEPSSTADLDAHIAAHYGPVKAATEADVEPERDVVGTGVTMATRVCSSHMEASEAGVDTNAAVSSSYVTAVHAAATDDADAVEEGDSEQ